MSTDDEFSSEQEQGRPEDVAEGITSGPEGNGDLDEQALDARMPEARNVR